MTSAYSVGTFSYTDISLGDIVQVNDRRYEVVSLPDQDPDAYRWYAQDGETINAELPVETIFSGVNVETGKTYMGNLSEIAFLIKASVLD